MCWIYFLGLLMIITLPIMHAGQNCSTEEFKCRDGLNCIPVVNFCDTVMDCSDGSDEPAQIEKIDNSLYEVCRGRSEHRSGFCELPSDLELDRQRLCRERMECSKEEFACRDGSMCIPVLHFCDTMKNCIDESDEPRTYPMTENTLVNICRGRSEDQSGYCILPSDLEHDRLRLCRNESTSCSPGEYACRDGSSCLHVSYFCDGFPSCKDRSDEPRPLLDADSAGRLCMGRELSGTKPHPYCRLRDEEICDGLSICSNGVDECFCGDNNEGHIDNGCFRCLSNPTQIIGVSSVCDGFLDCHDLSDECLCQAAERPKICERMKWGMLNATENRSSHLRYTNAIDQNLMDGSMRRFVCDEKTTNGQVENAKHCVKQPGALCKIDGPFIACEYEHEDPAIANCVSDDIHCKQLPKAYLPTSDSNSSDRWSSCETWNYGYKDCLIAYNCTKVPYRDVKSIRECSAKDAKCNISEWCEVGCPCFYFHCDDGKVISEDSVCDGYKDCSSGSDECQPGCIESSFSDEKSMIKSTGVLVLVWTFSVTAIFGCTSVVGSNLHGLLESPNGIVTSSHTTINRLLIMSLSVADLLVGVYTISICIKAAVFEGIYCDVDVEWRTSTACSMLGALLIVGSEQSVFTMVLITIHRLHAVMRPHATPHYRRAIMAVGITWLISIFVGLIPLIPSLEDYFLQDISFNNIAIFKTKVNQTQKEYLINWLGLMNDSDIQELHFSGTGWGKLRRLVAQINPNIRAVHEFGYYSSHTVCLPALFPDRQYRSWSYSLLLLLINFGAFICMLVCYIILYRQAYSKKILASLATRKHRDEQGTAMQRKLTRILVSDFMCWMPICIMGFLKLAGVDIPTDAYLPSGLLILPINSALNPFLYSDLPDVISNRGQTIVIWLTQSFRRLSSVRESTIANLPREQTVEMAVSGSKRHHIG